MRILPAPFLVAALSFASAAVVNAQQQPADRSLGCPSNSGASGLSGGKDANGYEPNSKQPAEKSAILPAAPQNEQSAAPTVQQDGKAMTSDANCDREPNKAR